MEGDKHTVDDIWISEMAKNQCRSRTVQFRWPLTWSRNPDVAPPPNSAYYSVVLHPKLLLVALDCYEVSLLGVDNSKKYYEQAWIVGLDTRYNGGCSTRHWIQWLDQELAKARRKKHAIVIGKVMNFYHSYVTSD